jgi:hypothetical protein
MSSLPHMNACMMEIELPVVACALRRVLEKRRTLLEVQQVNMDRAILCQEAA